MDTSDGESRIKNLDAVFPDWYTLSHVGCEVQETIDWNAFEISTASRVQVIPRFSNIHSVA